MGGKLSINSSIQFIAESNTSFGARDFIIADQGAPEIRELLKGAQAPALTLGLHASPAAVLQTITTALAGMAGARLHIVAHGRPGAFFLGGQWIDEAALAASASLVSLWGVDRIALWSCDVGQDAGLVSRLSRLTGARVEASTQPLGWQEGGANWSLDCSVDAGGSSAGRQAGVAMTSAVLPVEPSLMASWPYQLAVLNLTGAAVYAITSTVDKETNVHTFNTTSLASSYTVDDVSGGQRFSGNDVVLKLSFGSTIVYGWVSRPIKVGGEVVGFYFWKDNSFVDIATATAAGNTDADSNPADNTGYVLVVPGKTSFFTSGTIGSSSDRVDSALNSLFAVNAAPTAVADVTDLSLAAGASGGPALEAGYNQTTVNAIGNVLTNDTDPNAGDTKTVVKAGTSTASSSVTASTTSANGLTITGAYGTLKIGADGTYVYAIDNSNTEVQKLRQASNTLSDTFTYQMSDGSGATSTTTLTVKIKGTNDAPVANVDYGTAKESITTPTAVTGYNATGNVLTNDTDVDGYSETKAVVGITGTASGTNTGGTTTLSFATLPSNISVGYFVFDGSAGGLDNTYGTATLLKTAGNANITVTAIDTVNKTFTLSGTPFPALASNQVLGFANNTSGAAYKEATISTSTPSATTTVKLSSVSGTVAVGMTLSGTAITVTGVTYDGSGNVSEITLSSATSVSGSVTFTASAGTEITGRYGKLTLNSNGTYTYVPTADNGSISEGQSVTETFNYTMQDALAVTSSSQLYITVYGTGTNDPVVASDTSDLTITAGASGGPALEAGFGTATADAIGNVLTNDSAGSGATSVTVTAVKLASAGSSQTVSASTTSADGRAITGSYGTLTIGADGSYKYVVDNSNATVNALNTNDKLSETFVYTVTNNLGKVSSTTLTVIIKGTNDAPVATNDTAAAVEAGGVNNSIAGIDPTGNVLNNDSDVDNTAASLTVTKAGTTVAGTNVAAASTSTSSATSITGTYGTLAIGADGSWKYTVDPNNSTVNNLSPASTPLTDTFTYEVSDPDGGTHTATLTVSISGADDLVGVNNVYVNEASPYAVFKVSGVAGVQVSLALGNSSGLASSDAKATLGTDLSNTLEYYDTATSTWTNYSAAVAIPTGGTLLVRVAITADTTHEGNESFTLNVTPAGGSVLYGIGTIGDEGEGSVFLDTNTSGNPDTSGASFPAQLDDDRPLSVNDIRVNEASAYAMFEVTGAYDQKVKLALANGATSPATSTTDYGPALQYWNGSAWTSYTANSYVTISATNGKLLVRTAIVNDTDNEGDEKFTLTATNAGGSNAVGTATIDDHYGGVIYTFNGTGGASSGTTTTGLNDDRPITVTSPTVNEASPYAVFTVTGTAGQTISLALANGTDAQGSGVDYGSATATTNLQYSLDGGTTWLNYSTTGAPTLTGTTMLVRTPIIEDTTRDDGETFTLTATPAGGVAVVGTATINDQGGGDIFNRDGSLDTVTAKTTDSGLSITSVTVNEASPYAVFTVSNATNQVITLVLANGTGAQGGGTDYGSATATTNLQYSLDGGTTWLDYSTTGAPTVVSSMLVRTPIIEDSIQDNGETFTLTATPAGGVAVVGTAIINDQGAGKIFNANGTENVGATKSDDRPVTVTSPTVNEASPYAVFTVGGAIGQTISLALANGSGAQGGGTDYGSATATDNLQYSLDGGVTWKSYSTDPSPTLTGTSMLVRTPIVEDTLQDNGETFTLTATPLGGTAAVGTATINDAGGGTIYNGDGTVNNSATKTDDTPAPSPAPAPAPAPKLSADIDPRTDTGENDRITESLEPEFTIKGGALLTPGGSARLLDPSGNVVGTSQVTPEDIKNGTINVAPGFLDDGTYTFMSQILDATGKVVGEVPVVVTVVTDRDGVQPSVELAANGGDFNKDGILDWRQNNVAQLPIISYADYLAGKSAPTTSFGAVMAGSPDATAPGGVRLDDSVQLVDLKIDPLPSTPIPKNFAAQTDLINFTIEAQTGKTLVDIDSRPGLQTQVVIDLPKGTLSNAYLKFDSKSNTWVDFTNPAALNGSVDGAALVDTNGDGLIDRIVITLTDGGPGDEDGVVNGKIVDPGALAFRAGLPVYFQTHSSGDRTLSLTSPTADPEVNVQFYLAPTTGPNTIGMKAWFNPLTGDWFYGRADVAAPYACYIERPDIILGNVWLKDAGVFNVRTYMNSQGITQIMSAENAQQLGLLQKGYVDLGDAYVFGSDQALPVIVGV